MFVTNQSLKKKNSCEITHSRLVHSILTPTPWSYNQPLPSPLSAVELMIKYTRRARGQALREKTPLVLLKKKCNSSHSLLVASHIGRIKSLTKGVWNSRLYKQVSARAPSPLLLLLNAELSCVFSWHENTPPGFVAFACSLRAVGMVKCPV